MVSEAHIVLKEVRNERLYQMIVPLGVSFADAEQVALQMVEAIRELAKRAEEANKLADAEVQSSSDAALPENTDVANS